MLEALKILDSKILLAVNHFLSPEMDKVMLFISNSFIPAVVIIFIVFRLNKKYLKKNFFILLLLLFVQVGITDLISTRVLKNNIERLRPCHTPQLKTQLTRISQRCGGGKYGFVSSHAANTFGIATILSLLFLTFTRKTLWLFLWATIVSYSRMYLGKHYPMDLIGGAIVGILSGYLFFLLIRKLLFFNSGKINRNQIS